VKILFGQIKEVGKVGKTKETLLKEHVGTWG